MRSLRMHPRLAIGVAAVVCVVLVFLGLRQVRIYSAQSVVYVEPIIPGSYNEAGQPGFDQFRYASYVDQQMQTVVRPDILMAALKTLPPNTWRQPGESQQSAVMRLQKALVVERQLTSYQITIKLLTTDPETSANIVNAVTDAYLQGGRRDEITQASGRERLLGEERQRITEELDRDRKEEVALGTNLGVANPNTVGENPFDITLANLRLQLATARQAHDIAAAQLSSVSGDQPSSKSGLTAAADESINADQGLSSMKSSVNARRVVLESQMAGLTPSNPTYKQDQDEIADLDRRLDSLTKQERSRAEIRIQDKLRTELQRTATVEGQLNAQLAQATAQATGAGPKLQRASELATDIQRLTAQYSTVDETLRGLELQTNGPGLEHLALAAPVPAGPEPNKRQVFLLGALPVGLLFGLIAAVIARARDRRVYVGADLEQAIGFAPIAVLPAREDVPARVGDEYVLRLAAGVEGAYRTSGARSFIVTSVSATSDQGALLKSLAQQLEEMRLRVQVVRASELLTTSDETAQHRIAGSQDTNGLTPWGSPAGEGIATAKLDRMKSDFDITLIDAAPLLHSAATEYAARCADATVLVAESGVTLSTEITQAAALLVRLRVTGVAAVLEGLRLQFADDAFKAAVRAVEHRNVEAKVERPVPSRVQQAEAAPAVDEVPMPEAAIEPEVPELVALHSRGPAAKVVDEPLVVTPSVGEVVEIAPTEEIPVESTEPMVAAHAPGAALDAVEPWDWQIPVPQKHTMEPVPAVGPEPAIAAQALALPEEWEVPVPQPLTRRVSGPAVWAQHDGLDTPVPVVDRSLVIRPAARTRPGIELKPLVPAASIEAPQSLQPGPEDSPSHEDLKPVGRFVGDSGVVEAVPSHTRSKIRLAFKEQEVNSKTTWFSKLFRGDPAASFKITPEDEEEGMPEEYAPVQRLPEITHTDDPELRHLLNRVSGGRKIAQTAPPVDTTQPQTLEARLSEAVHAPVAQVAAPAEVQEPAPSASFIPEPAPTFAHVEAPPVEAPYRPLRPLTFQQLAGEEVAAEPTAYESAAYEPAAYEPVQLPAEPIAVAPVVDGRAMWPSKAPRVAEIMPEPSSPALTKAEPSRDEPVIAAVHQVPEITPLSARRAAFVPETTAPVPAPPGVAADAPRVVRSPFLPDVYPDPLTDPSPAHRSPSRLEPIMPIRSEQSPWLHRSSAMRGVAQPAIQAASVAEPTYNPAPAAEDFDASPEPVARSHAEPVAPAVDQAQPELRVEDEGIRAVPIPQPVPQSVADAAAGTPMVTRGLSRRWALLSQFEPSTMDPTPAGRTVQPRIVERKPRLAEDAQG